jgi:hypothetical protein
MNRPSMTFSEYLMQLPSNIVFEGLLKHSTLPRRIISSAMVNDIAPQFSSEKALIERFSALSENAKFSCSLAYLFDSPGLAFDQAPHVFGIGALHGGLPQAIKSGDVNETMRAVFGDELVKSFLVYAARDDFGKIFFVGFKEFEPKLRKLCCQTIIGQTHIAGEKEPYDLMPALFINDVAAVVGLASQGTLKKTKLGPLGKISSQSLGKLLHFTHTPFDVSKTSEPLPILPLHYALSRGLIYGIGDGYAVSHDRMLDWLVQPLQNRCSDFVAFACDSLHLWRGSILLELFQKPGKPWLSSALFGERLKNDIATAVKLFAYCGLVDMHKSPGQTFFTRAAQPASPDEPDHAARILLMPDFSAMIPQEISADHLYWFSKFGDLLSFDKIYKGTINRNIINTSLSSGIAGETLLEWLSRWHAPKNVAETVKEWIREFSRISFETGSFIVSAEEKVTKQLLSYAPLKNALQPIKAHCIFRVAPGREHHVNEILVSMGFDARTPRLLRANPSHDSSEGLFAENREAAQPTPIVSALASDAPSLTSVKQGKYSSQLKALDLTDLMHVVDYALLMGHNLRFEYSGSPYIKKGIYLAQPLSYKKGVEPLLEAEVARTKKKKIFLINRITKIGVEPAND